MSEYRRESQTLLLLKYLRQHPGLALSISYALLTMCGILYSASFYNEFNVAILKLTNVSDLMIAGLSEPAALLMFAGGMLMAVSVDLLSRYFHKIETRWKEKPKSIKRAIVKTLVYTPKKSETIMLMTIGCFVLYAFIFVSEFAEWHSKRIKQGHGDKVMVTSQAVGSDAKELTLLGSTTHFVITYNADDDQVIIIPVENLDRLSTIPSAPEK